MIVWESSYHKTDTETNNTVCRCTCITYSYKSMIKSYTYMYVKRMLFRKQGKSTGINILQNCLCLLFICSLMTTSPETFQLFITQKKWVKNTLLNSLLCMINSLTTYSDRLKTCMEANAMHREIHHDRPNQ